MATARPTGSCVMNNMSACRTRPGSSCRSLSAASAVTASSLSMRLPGVSRAVPHEQNRKPGGLVEVLVVECAERRRSARRLRAGRSAWREGWLRHCCGGRGGRNPQQSPHPLLNVFEFGHRTIRNRLVEDD